MKIFKISRINFPRELTSRQMVDFITNQQLRDWNGKLDIQDAKDIAYWSDKWTLQEISLDLFNWLADPKYKNKSKNVPPIVLKTEDGYDVLDGKHRIGMAKANGEKTITVYLGVEPGLEANDNSEHKDMVVLKSLLNDPSIQELACVYNAQKALQLNDFKGAIKALSIDADKIRTLNKSLYGLINKYENL